ncbi:MAG: GH92 family glycosyl hydrolase [Mangrovibacterium sp.]
MIYLKSLVIGFILLSGCLNKQEKGSGLDDVDPSIGGVGVILEPTRPTVHLPNSMVRVFPLRKDHLDDQIGNFPLTVTSHRLSPVFAFMPLNGPVDQNSWNKRLVYRHEILTPYYYRTLFEDSGDELEFSPQARSGFFRIHFSGDQEHYLRMGVFNGSGEIKVEGKRQISGYEEFSGMKAYFYAETDADVAGVTYKNQTDKTWLLLNMGKKDRIISFRYGISFISIDQARQNLEKEIVGWNFEQLKEHAQEVWEKTLNKIRIKGGAEAQKRVFYTALYRCYERMVNINEYGRYYSSYDHRVHESDEPFYVDNWIWDTYIALEPLHMILNPDRVTDEIRSYIRMYEQGGYMPSFALVSGDWPAMTGNFAAAWMADAWFKGLRGFDIKTAYEGLRKNSLDATLIPWRNGPKTSLDDFYNEHGYMPGLVPGEQETIKEVDPNWEKRQSVSVTTANSYSDWCIARLASELNYKEDEKLFLKRSRNYKNVFRAEKGFMWPKDQDGNWIEPFDPRFAGREYFTENNAYTYNWDVKHDLKGLFDLMGGRHKAEEKLDQLFRENLGLPKWKFWYTQPDASGLVGQFVMGNEPGFHIPYIYNYLGAPWKTQKRIRMLLDTFFTDNLFGISGDEDGGGMSAFVIFSMMGFFPVTPGIPVYDIGSPVFDEVTISLSDDRTFTIVAKNNSTHNRYIQQAWLNGKSLDKPWFTHDDLIKGGKLELMMGDQPNKQWGSNPGDASPSAIK